jgi:hypothetical protein
MATAGDLCSKFTDENLTKWIKNFGGRYSLDFDESVTHLIATDKQFKKNGSRGQIHFHFPLCSCRRPFL